MLKIKITPYRKILGTIYDRQSAGHNMVSLDGKYCFCIGEDVKEADFWVVHGKGLRQDETCMVAPENTIMLTTEPKSVLVYPDKYISQFGLINTSQTETVHKNIHYGPAILPWFVGYSEKDEENGILHPTLDYDILKNSDTPKKEKLISVITSNKSHTQGHIERIRFVGMLKEHFGDQIDIFGRGFNSFEDKWDVLAPYKYHIVIENSSERYYWTEKISDCYLAETYPLYYGCTHLSEYFPDQSFTSIDIRKPNEAIEIIDKAIRGNVYENSQESLRISKNLVLDKYNMLEYIARLCDTLDPNAKKESVTLHPCVSSGDKTNLWHYLVSRSYYKIKNSIVNRKYLKILNQ